MFGNYHLEPWDWTLAALAALAVGLSKSGFAGTGLVTVLLMAEVFPARESTGLVLPMLIMADMVAVAIYRRHADWKTILRVLPPAVVGIVLGFFLFGTIPEVLFRRVLGWMVLALAAVQIIRLWRGALFESLPHTKRFAWFMGTLTGVTTMLANAAGPVASLYLVAQGFKKMAFVGTTAWLFCMINLIKLPFSAGLGMISASSLKINLILAPVILLGLWIGTKLLAVVSQSVFDALVLVFAIIASLRLIFF